MEKSKSDIEVTGPQAWGRLEVRKGEGKGSNHGSVPACPVKSGRYHLPRWNNGKFLSRHSSSQHLWDKEG